MDQTGSTHGEQRKYVRLPVVSMAIKTVADFIITAISLILLLPLIAVIAVIIKVQSPGPVFFRQVRFGKHGRPFRIYKFRSMVQNAEDVLKQNAELREKHKKDFKLDSSDPRITPIGRILRRTSLDELPQLLNVMKGEMSLVGPRPLVPEEIKQYYVGLEYKLFAVKPGITGYWQAQRGQGIAYPERVNVELYYVDHFSLWLDLLITLKTIKIILTRRNH